jgi:hypothetical protein
MKENIDTTYERVKNNKIGWREEIAIGDKLYLVFARPDEKIKGQTEIVFRELVK